MQFPTSPSLAVPLALSRAQMPQGEVDFWEINQAFSVVDLVNQHLLGLDPARYFLPVVAAVVVLAQDKLNYTTLVNQQLLCLDCLLLVLL